MTLLAPVGHFRTAKRSRQLDGPQDDRRRRNGRGSLHSQRCASKRLILKPVRPRTESVPRVRDKAGCLLSPLHATLYWRLSPWESGKRKRRARGIPIGKEEVKRSLFTSDIVLHAENPQKSS